MKLSKAKEAVEVMLDHMTSPESATRLDLLNGESVVVLLNNLGSVTNLEMGVLANDVMTLLTSSYGVKIERMYVGTFVTSLEMSGISITVLKLKTDFHIAI